ncbi:MAG: peptidoglycan DD-metalloendopeptidase family protein [Gammaproteobacteria bacterium]|nr:peptidoglycan DD-metalloendopeptidase family protein [Gammaproteobacteria bacterium]
MKPLFLLFLFTICLPVLADDKAQLSQKKLATQELNQLKQKISQLKNELSSISQKKNKHLYKLQQSDLKINAISNKIHKLNIKIQNLQKQQSNLNKSLIKHNQNLSMHQNILSQQVAASYQAGKQELVKLLLNQQQPAKFNRIMTYYEYFHKARLHQIQQVSQIISKIGEEQHQLQLTEQEISLQQHLLEQEHETFKQEKSKQQFLISELNERQKQSTDQLEQLIKDKNRLNQLLSQIQAAVNRMAALEQQKPFKQLKGKLTWPSSGKLKKLYGRWRSVNKVKWNGNIIQNPEGSEVYSISSGRVVFSDWFRGYGLLTIIDHGQQYMSLYGHSQSLLKSVGDEVYVGEQIATSGRTGGNAIPGTYFEVRYKGQPVNPSSWCKKMPKS